MGGETEEDQVEKKKVVASMFKSLQTREALCKLSIELPRQIAIDNQQ